MDGTTMRRVVVVVATTAAAFVCTICYWWWWSRRQSRPTKWQKVGEISEIFFFPVKSLGPIRVTDIECTILGCKSGWLRDRTLMIIDSSTGRFVTARKIPKMVQVIPSSGGGSVLTLRAPGMMTIDVDLAQIGGHDNGQVIMSSVWDQPVPARDCGEEAARWLSRFLLQKDTGLRLVYYPLDKPYRDIRLCNQGFPRMKSTDIGAYPDASAYTLLNEASIADLNSRLMECPPVTPLQFRMNFIVRGAQIFDEDSWDWIKIGSIIFRNVKPCTRCIFTTIDPAAGVKNDKTEPLKTLKKFRQIEEPAEIRRLVGDSPVMGIHLGLRGPNGVVTVGDDVFVGES